MAIDLKEEVKELLRPAKKLIKRMLNAKRNKKCVQACMEKDDVKIELGAGPFRKSGWISLDLSGADINIDLTKSVLPFPDNSVDCFYSSHVFEHFSYPEPMLSILKECYRCLKNGGTFEISVPNAAMYVDAYFIGEYPKGTQSDPHLPAFHHNSPIDIINYTAYMAGEHKHMFDIQGLLAILKEAGFKTPVRREYNPSIDLEVRQWESIYAKAYK